MPTLYKNLISKWTKDKFLIQSLYCIIKIISNDFLNNFYNTGRLQMIQQNAVSHDS